MSLHQVGKPGDFDFSFRSVLEEARGSLHWGVLGAHLGQLPGPCHQTLKVLNSQHVAHQASPALPPPGHGLAEQRCCPGGGFRVLAIFFELLMGQ